MRKRHERISRVNCWVVARGRHQAAVVMFFLRVSPLRLLPRHRVGPQRWQTHLLLVLTATVAVFEYYLLPKTNHCRRKTNTSNSSTECANTPDCSRAFACRALVRPPTNDTVYVRSVSFTMLLSSFNLSSLLYLSSWLPQYLLCTLSLSLALSILTPPFLLGSLVHLVVILIASFEICSCNHNVTELVYYITLTEYITHTEKYRSPTHLHNNDFVNLINDIVNYTARPSRHMLTTDNIYYSMMPVQLGT